MIKYGGSLFCFTVGAILYFAVTGEVQNINVQTVGLILMIVGAVALALSFVTAAIARSNQQPPPPPPPNYPPRP